MIFCTLSKKLKHFLHFVAKNTFGETLFCNTFSILPKEVIEFFLAQLIINYYETFVQKPKFLKVCFCMSVDQKQ